MTHDANPSRSSVARQPESWRPANASANNLYGPSNGQGLGSIIGKAVAGDHGIGLAAAALEPHSGIPLLAAKTAAKHLAGKLATSQNPTVIRLLTGAGGKSIDPTVAAYIARALSGSAAGGVSTATD